MQMPGLTQSVCASLTFQKGGPAILWQTDFSGPMSHLCYSKKYVFSHNWPLVWSVLSLLQLAAVQLPQCPTWWAPQEEMLACFCCLGKVTVLFISFGRRKSFCVSSVMGPGGKEPLCHGSRGRCLLPHHSAHPVQVLHQTQVGCLLHFSAAGRWSFHWCRPWSVENIDCEGPVFFC